MCRARAWKPPKISFRPKHTGRPICRASSRDDLIRHRQHGIDGRRTEPRPLGQRRLPPFLLRRCASASAASISACEAQGRSATIEPSIGETIFTIFMFLGSQASWIWQTKTFTTKEPRKKRMEAER